MTHPHLFTLSIDIFFVIVSLPYSLSSVFALHPSLRPDLKEKFLSTHDFGKKLKLYFLVKVKLDTEKLFSLLDAQRILFFEVLEAKARKYCLKKK